MKFSHKYNFGSRWAHYICWNNRDDEMVFTKNDFTTPGVDTMTDGLSAQHFFVTNSNIFFKTSSEVGVVIPSNWRSVVIQLLTC